MANSKLASGVWYDRRLSGISSGHDLPDNSRTLTEILNAKTNNNAPSQEAFAAMAKDIGYSVEMQWATSEGNWEIRARRQYHPPSFLEIPGQPQDSAVAAYFRKTKQGLAFAVPLLGYIFAKYREINIEEMAKNARILTDSIIESNRCDHDYDITVHKLKRTALVSVAGALAGIGVAEVMNYLTNTSRFFTYDGGRLTIDIMAAAVGFCGTFIGQGLIDRMIRGKRAAAMVASMENPDCYEYGMNASVRILEAAKSNAHVEAETAAYGEYSLRTLVPIPRNQFHDVFRGTEQSGLEGLAVAVDGMSEAEKRTLSATIVPQVVELNRRREVRKRVLEGRVPAKYW